MRVYFHQKSESYVNRSLDDGPGYNLLQVVIGHELSRPMKFLAQSIKCLRGFLSTSLFVYIAKKAKQFASAKQRALICANCTGRAVGGWLCKRVRGYAAQRRLQI